MAILEVACFNKDSAAVACEAGADRVELCADEHLGGTTPSMGTVKEVVARAVSKAIPVNVMIRPRGGDFNYTEAEFVTMKDSIRSLKTLVNGLVFGILKTDLTVDVGRTAELVREARPLPCTFHRAFDKVPDMSIALEDVITTGCTSILSSGGASDALEGVIALRKLVLLSGGRLDIIAGGGVRSGNMAQIISTANAPVCHTSALLQGADVADSGEIVQMMRLLLQ